MTEIIFPKISIITTFYNSVKLGDFVHRAMKSLLNQTYENIEFICVNDGSTDETLAHLKDYEKKDPRIIIINKKIIFSYLCTCRGESLFARTRHRLFFYNPRVTCLPDKNQYPKKIYC